MRMLNSKLKYISPNMFQHRCPGCNDYHNIDIVTHRWNGEVDNITITPALNIVAQCHYYLLNGSIVFCNDCFHEYAGKTILLPNLPKI